MQVVARAGFTVSGTAFEKNWKYLCFPSTNLLRTLEVFLEGTKGARAAFRVSNNGGNCGGGGVSHKHVIIFIFSIHHRAACEIGSGYSNWIVSGAW